MGSGLNSFKPMKEAVEEFTKEVGVAVTGHPKHDLAELLKQIFALEPVRQIGASAPFTPEGFATQVFCGSSGAEEAAARGLLRALIHARVPAAIPGETSAPLPLRIHYFFHNAGRLWACVIEGCMVRLPGRRSSGELSSRANILTHG